MAADCVRREVNLKGAMTRMTVEQSAARELAKYECEFRWKEDSTTTAYDFHRLGWLKIQRYVGILGEQALRTGVAQHAILPKKLALAGEVEYDRSQDADPILACRASRTPWEWLRMFPHTRGTISPLTDDAVVVLELTSDEGEEDKR